MHILPNLYYPSVARKLKYLLAMLLISISAMQLRAQGVAADSTRSDSVKTESAGETPVITIGGNVYGGGEQGKVEGDATVIVKSATIGGRDDVEGGNIYGGGNLGDLDGQTTVTIQGGDIHGGVFGGARMADIGKSTFVNIDGANQLHDMTINDVYGGNDISGTIGANLTDSDPLRFEPEVNADGKNIVTKEWNAYILTTKEVAGKHIYIGEMYGGGNGDYQYPTETNAEGKYEVKPVNGGDAIATRATAFIKPEVPRTYMQVNGGTYGYVYAGGNAATVQNAAVISINNSSDVTTSTEHLNVGGYTRIEDLNMESLNTTDQRLLEMGINLSTFNNDKQFIRIFGGNNKEKMSIQPIWNLAKGSIHNLYSGGNQGDMTNSNGLLLEIKEGSQISADNVYGGCRRANVMPMAGSSLASASAITVPAGYTGIFKPGLPARVLINGGNIGNVYGGNDISGNVYYGASVSIFTSVSGNIYGGGNGSYAYTDNASLENDVIWGDFYYDVNAYKGRAAGSAFTQQESVEALNDNRPNTESVSLYIKGTETKPLIIHGAVYCGGNSTTLRNTRSGEATSELKIGSYVTMDNVFMGCNGEKMIEKTASGVLARYFGNVINDDKESVDFSSLNFKSDANSSTLFADYMEGTASAIFPKITFDADYVNYSTKIGSFFCGGNVSSMNYAGTNVIEFDKDVIIYDKFVGGCNNANVSESDYNVNYEGGILGSADERASYTEADGTTIKDRIHLILSGKETHRGIKIQPKRWNSTNTDLEWNLISVATKAPIENVPAGEVIPAAGKEADATDLDRRLTHGNIYGGCYISGHINGNVVIDLNASIIDKNMVFDVVEKTGDKLYDNEKYTIKTRNSGVILDEQGMDVLGSALNVFGGGYGKGSEVWGSATVNLTKGYTFQIFGGGEEGAIGRKNSSGEYVYDARYSTYVNLRNEDDIAGAANNDVAEAEFLYGGGFEGPVLGNTILHLDNGRIFNSFAGSCNADIYGHTETYVGVNGFPYVRDHIYGGNDLGGKILGEGTFKDKVRADIISANQIYNPNSQEVPDVVKAAAYIEYRKGHVENIFGGCYGDYDYTDRIFSKYTEDDGNPKEGFTKPRMGNAFVYFKPENSNNLDNQLKRIFGAGQGHASEIEGTTVKSETDRDVMQDRSYVLIDNTLTSKTFDDLEIFGAGENCGLGMRLAPDEAKAAPNTVSAVIDLVHGKFSSVYGGSFSEGFTRRTVVNVPQGSNINMSYLYGGAYGVRNEIPCDVYESNVNYNSNDAFIKNIYGGNNSYRRTLYAKVNINAVLNVMYNGSLSQGTVYGAGYGKDTWAQYTEINLNPGSKVYEAYGGSQLGKVYNVASLNKWKEEQDAAGKVLDLRMDLKNNAYTDDGLDNDLAQYFELANDVEAGGMIKDIVKEKYNCNVEIHENATVVSYTYGAGLGKDGIANSGDVYGTSYIALLGGAVLKDLYAAGTTGSVCDKYGVRGDFEATSTAYIKGGTARNVYGGGWKGAVGLHDESTTETTGDIMGKSQVVIGFLGSDGAKSFANGLPVIQRNAYGGGEGGAIYGTANLIFNSGYIGFYYDSEESDPAKRFKEKLDDETWAIEAEQAGRLKDSGNIFGGGYIDYSNVDYTVVTMYGGIVRNGLYGGGEIGTVGRGTTDGVIHKAGRTHVYIYKGKVLHDVFGGGRGFNNLGDIGTLGTAGYVFGSTDVHIRGGEIGTSQGIAEGFGNVFGGGNTGYVYSGEGVKMGSDPDNIDMAHGLPIDGGGYYYKGGVIANGMTMDCSVEVEPYCLVTDAGGVTIDGTDYAYGEYVPTEALNKLKNKNTDAAKWGKLNIDGVKIYNAVFAGGNVATGSDRIYANTVTVFGNAFAALRDIYHRDLITVGTEHVGGLYGDGNLTFVDGFRELYIDNFGTDYYGMSDNITLEEYNTLTDRERAYFELKYKCITPYTATAKDGKEYTYALNAQLGEEDFHTLWEGTEQATNWTELGFCSIYAGRLLNTIQRADMCGVFGSRMVLQGAMDRVPEEVDYTNYTINRVNEISLNKRESTAGDTGDDAFHGNYFGIYNIVNYLGNLTSDNFLYENERTVSDQETGDNVLDGSTYAAWKDARYNKRNRNNATSYNKVALASGVYLELTTEKSTKTTKDWGYIIGVVQLELINVMTGMGGGYVYAKNEHGARTRHADWDKVTLSPYNRYARTYRRFTFDETNLQRIQTSGNFVHPTGKTIIDDCYPISNKYEGPDAAPAHYWYIKGEIYVYDQFISAYTGSANAYSKNVSIPLTITAASNGRVKLVDVKQNLYAYYNDEGQKLASDDKFIVNNITYHLNDTITYWDYYQLSRSEKAHFVQETYTTVSASTVGETDYPRGYTMLPAEYDSLYAIYKDVKIRDNEKDEEVNFTDIFRMTNNLGHNTGYILTCDMNNPKVWDDYFIKASGTDKIISQDRTTDEDKAAYTVGSPTYTPKVSGVYGQHEYAVGDIIDDEIVKIYEAIAPEHIPSGQATIKDAYVVTKEIVIVEDGTEKHLNPGLGIAKEMYSDAVWSSIESKVAPAYICTSTLELSKTDFVYSGELLTEAQIEKLKTDYPAMAGTIDGYFSKAHYCTEEGKYGGNYYVKDNNYRGIEAWCSLSKEDREHFEYNYDALDVLIDPLYRGNTKYYDTYDGSSELLYAKEQPIDYQATNTHAAVTYKATPSSATTTIAANETIFRDDFEKIPNEQRHYSAIMVETAGDYYVVNTSFLRGDVPYNVGKAISEEVFNTLDDTQKDYVDKLTFTDAQAGTGKKYFYCRQSYTVGENGGTDGNGKPVTNIFGGTSYNNGATVPLGCVITEDNYKTLENLQKGFEIHGTSPEEITTLYVSRESDIYDLSRGKTITVMLQYEYEEPDESGFNTELIREQHIINIHLDFKSGVPSIGELTSPPVILPGSTVGLKVPTVTKGAYEILGGGWEIFSSQRDAESHTNGLPYINNYTPMYWYQDGYWVAYYSKTYLGKTYSKAVQFRVANYHDIDVVLANKANHLYIDNPTVKRFPKIYINNGTCTSDAAKSKLDLLKDLFDLSVGTFTTDPETGLITDAGTFKDHAPLNSHVKNLENLDFILKSNVAPKQYTDWTPIANAATGECFAGTLHGNGYTISGLNNSLFNHLCGSVYNLGVTGSFTTSGIAETGKGYVENCWINTTGMPAAESKPIFGNPNRDVEGQNIQIVNSYYPKDKYTAKHTDATHGIPTEKPLKAFQNGEVAYDLNGFYLNKRYYDKVPSGDYEYQYYDTKVLDGTGKPTKSSAKYPETNDFTYGYVEKYYADGDFIYSNGTIPADDAADDIRFHAEEKAYYPLWPDDYLFFGQMLTYGHIPARTAQDQPSNINKSGSYQLATGDQSNRVYRAPAYFRNSEKSIAHFNPSAVFATKYSDNVREAYPGLTAIDFTGYNDVFSVSGDNAVAKPYTRWDDDADGVFFNPALDDDGLTAFRNIDETQNLLVYTPQSTGVATDAATMTNSVLTSTLPDVTFSQTNDTYRTVAVADANSVKGHCILRDASGVSYTSLADNLLVDKQEFNAPIAYKLADGKRMWYQRTPDNYVDAAKGWEAISLPFEAELVTTQNKGELTHFYTNSTTGHEYWLRGYTGGESGVLKTEGDVVTINMTYPTTGTHTKNATSTFLWDYYYSKQPGVSSGKDDNTDEYQIYYQTGRTYENYPYSEAGRPYIVGFPGKRYYEFDLSGQFIPQNNYGAEIPYPGRQKQIITFASVPATQIAVSDTEITSKTTSGSGYSFVPNYLSTKLPASGNFVLNGDGSSFDVTSVETTVLPFRPYFAAVASPSKPFQRLVFGNNPDTQLDPSKKDLSLNSKTGINIYGKKGQIVVETNMDVEDVQITITDTKGVIIEQATMGGHDTQKFPVQAGVYIVNNRKVFVK